MWLEKQIREYFNRRQAKREDFAARTIALKQLATTRFRLSEVVSDVMQGELGYRPHRGMAHRADGDVDYSYAVATHANEGGFGRLHKPFVVSTIIETQAGDFFDVPSERYTSYRRKHSRVFSVALTHDGEFHLQSEWGRPVRLGTTALIKGHSDLLAVVRDQIKREHRS